MPKTRPAQRTLFGAVPEQPSPSSRRNIYAHDSSHLAAHHWYTTVAGYSGEFVLSTLREHGVHPGSAVLDPFSGCGTTALTAKVSGYHFGGTEANPFHFLVAKTKLNPPPPEAVSKFIERLDFALQSATKAEKPPRFEEAPIVSIKDHLSSIRSAQGHEALPELKGWLSPAVLDRVLGVKQCIDADVEPEIRPFFYVALGSVILPLSNMQLAGPKIAYRRRNGNRVLCLDGPIATSFLRKARVMLADLQSTKPELSLNASIHLGDARLVDTLVSGQYAIAITSPPYLNEVDYLENTRMEMFCLGLVSGNDGFRALKEGMIRANSKYLFNSNRDYPHNLPNLETFAEIRLLCTRIHEIWSKRSWGWDHPRLVAEYFVDMSRHLAAVHRLLTPGAKYVIVVGDSAIDGILVPTDLLLARLGGDVGFAASEVRPFRWRGSSRHTTRLRESIVTLTA